ncbi:hypothetical protein DSO57_1019077 [Entomophthora muscae]|uniref:Uncharacterized protein n=1 Tax=Entomophthora muscae TaxID=34485 RepID=A0ACC2ST97_9FUNG|nr:hypothetical protein DSO57_1019077 [Entomophthora muscae]
MSSLPDLEKSDSVPLRAPVVLPPALTCTPWLLTGLMLMVLNVYFPQLSPVSSLWSPPLSNCSSPPLGGILVVCFTGIGAKLTCQKEVTTRPPPSPANDLQLPPVSSPEWVIPFDCSGDMVNSSGGTKYCHFCSSEQAQLGSAARKTISQGLSPASEWSPDLKSAKIKEVKPPVIFHLNPGQVDNQETTPSRDQPAKLPQALYCPPGALFGPLHFTKYPPNPAYTEYNLETILIANPLARARETE